MSIADYYKRLNHLKWQVAKYKLGECFMDNRYLKSNSYHNMIEFYKEEIKFIRYLLRVKFNIDIKD